MTILDLIYIMLKRNWTPRNFIREDALKGLAEAGEIMHNWPGDNPVN